MPLLFRIGQCLGFLAWLVLPQYRRLAFRNVTIAFGSSKSAGESLHIVRRHFCRLGANFLCGLKVAIVPLPSLGRYVEVEGVDAINRHLHEKRGVILILSHLSNWEIISQILPKFIGHARNSTIYQPLRNRRIDAHVRKLRGRAGVEMFDRRAGFRKPIEVLRNGGAIGILSDQHAGDHGVWTPLFNKLASTTPLPALLARRTAAAIVHVAVYTEGVARWRVRVDAGPVLGHDSIQTLTAKANETVATHIRHAPEDWFWVHDRWKVPNPNFLLSRYKRGTYLPPSLPAHSLLPFRILVRSSNWLGDAVMSVAAVSAIKRGRPDAHVTILTPAKLAPMWRLVPDVDDVVALKSKSIFQAVRLIENLRPFEVAILFPNSLRSALEVWLADLPRRAGRHGHRRAWLLNQIVPERTYRGPPKHHSRQFLHIAQECGADSSWANANVSLPTKLPNGKRLGSGNKPLRLALSAGAEYGPAKRWLPDRFAAVAKAVSDAVTVQWVLLGTDKDMAVGKIIAEMLGDVCLDRIGQTTLEELIEELRSSELLLTNDTGTMHLATLLQIPVVAIFGSTEPALTGPIGENHIVIRHHVECSPCFLRECPIDFRCMHAVPVEEVREAVMSMLARRGSLRS